MRSRWTLLYVPADRPDRVEKALRSEGSTVVIDLEDAVAPAAKDAARSWLVGSLADLLERTDRAQPGSVQLRVNAGGSPWHAADLTALTGLSPGIGIRVPKVESPMQVQQVARAGGGRALHLLVESALGLERAYDLAVADRAVRSIGLGEADLRADLGVTGDDGLSWARSRVVCAAAAAGLEAPAMSVYADVADLDGLRESCLRGRALGMRGRAAIHPRQLPVIAAAFAAGADEVDRARQVLAAAERADHDGVGALALADGTFVDEAVVRQARRVLRDEGLAGRDDA